MEGNNLQIRPLFDNVVVRKDELEEKSKTGIIITGSDDQPALVGTVLSVGKDVEDQIKPGDKIMYAPFSGRELGGFLLLAQHDIMGVMIEEKEIQCPICKQVYPISQKHFHEGTTREREKEKMKCTTCGTEGYPKIGDSISAGADRCPNCGKNEWKKI
jgi:chaperonin GroES